MPGWKWSSCLAGALVLAACDHGAPPSIANLTASPLTVPVGTATTISGQLSFVDEDGDIDQFAISVVLPGGARQDIPPQDAQGVDGLTAGTLAWALILTPPTPGSYELEVSLVDVEGNASNVLTTMVTAE